MSGVTDVPFRAIARRFGNPLVYSEMVASGPFVARRMEDCLRAEQDTPGAPLVVQLAGCDAHWIGEAARCAEANGAAAIDLNMGCPSKKVTGGYAGSALMRDLGHALSLVQAAIDAVTVPVTVKMRLGWDSQSHNAAALAAQAREMGVRRVAVHGRTRCQFYTGSADWDAIRAVSELDGLSVFANGDITSLRAAREALSRSSAYGVMVGRGVLGQPWLLAEISSGLAGEAHVPPTREQRREIVLEHLERSASFYGTGHGLKVFRKHLSAYLVHDGASGAAVTAACRQETRVGMAGAVHMNFDRHDLQAAA